MHVAITGSSGLIGSALVNELTHAGHRITRLVRSAPSGQGRAAWDPESGRLETEVLAGCDAVVHLAGESIAAGRWTEERKTRIRESRVNGTRLLSGALAKISPTPKVLVSASAVGYYGDRGDQLLTEEEPPGSGFLADVCREWEAATTPAKDKGIRVVLTRFGVVLSARGGALAKMLTPFKMGVAGKIGSGRQYMSWITLDDAVSVIEHALTGEALSGPVNTVSPNPGTNYEFTKSLGRVLGRPTILPMPAFAARAAFGQMANELLLASARVKPARLQEAGFTFRHPELEAALRAVLAQ